MRQTQVFAGSSHPTLVDAMCKFLGCQPGKAELGKFANGEIKVELGTSIRNHDVFIVQSGSSRVNDHIMELLIMASACASGTARSVTAVMPYFPYSRQSKKKSHRGSITARMLANLMRVAGITHVITIDLHATQIQGFFHCPVDNLVAEPLLAHWIKKNISDWRKAVVVSKNPGGTKRVTSMADALKVGFGIVMTDRRRDNNSGHNSMSGSAILGNNPMSNLDGAADAQRMRLPSGLPPVDHHLEPEKRAHAMAMTPENIQTPPNGTDDAIEDNDLGQRPPSRFGQRAFTAPTIARDFMEDSGDEDDLQLKQRDIVTGRLLRGHIIDDHAPSPTASVASFARASNSGRIARNFSIESLDQENMMSSLISTTSSMHHHQANEGLGGSADVAASSEDEEEILINADFESMVTLVGNVRGRTVILLDDMIDKPGSWIAAAETVVKRGGATKVFCVATHGLFGGDCLQDMEECECINGIIVTNTFPVSTEKRATTSKLTVLDVSGLLAEAIRRNRHGESISALFQHPE